MNLLQMNQTMTSKLLEATLNTYSPFERARHLAFTISELSRGGITFKKRNGKEQTARRPEAEFVAANWEAYKVGRISRAELQKKSFNTPYLFGVLRFIDLESESAFQAS